SLDDYGKRRPSAKFDGWKFDGWRFLISSLTYPSRFLTRDRARSFGNEQDMFRRR
ncbi:MAG: hypothetical protein HC892_21575, partial [Saprospiraceae bacterium]|nr:hypothetical protein [Saprospiraceae bacterium]